MPKYYVNRNEDNRGHHEVHKDDCHKLPADRMDLGYHSSCHTAVAQAKLTYPTADGCGICSSECSTG